MYIYFKTEYFTRLIPYIISIIQQNTVLHLSNTLYSIVVIKLYVYQILSNLT